MKFGKKNGGNRVIHRIRQSGWLAERPVCLNRRGSRPYYYWNSKTVVIPHFDDPWAFRELSEDERTLQILAMGEKLAKVPEWVWKGKPCRICFPEARRAYDLKTPHCDTCNCEGKVRGA